MVKTILALAALAAWAPGAQAQQPAHDWEPRGFDFSPDGVWRKRARAVEAARQAAISRGDFAALNAASVASRSLPAGGFANIIIPNGLPNALTGVLRVPVLLVRYKNTNTGTLRTPAAYDSVLLGSTPPVGRVYTVTTLYNEMSHGLMTVQGVIVGWIALDSNEVWYAGPTNPACNGLGLCGHVAALIAEAVKHADSTVDFSQFDNDGPDGIPNSGDDDGIVDLVWLVHPSVGGECGNTSGIWAHRYYYSGWTGTTLATNDNRAGGGKIVVDNYTIQSGLGGVVGSSAGCDGTQIMAPGTIGHETGHGIGLPDFYDTSPSGASEGIGEWGLMGSGNWARPGSPAHYEAFSMARLGWVSVAPLSVSGTYHLGAVETSDSVFYVRPLGANPRGEYFLLENRQSVNSDSALIAKHGGGGLLIWHVDSLRYTQCTLPSNCVNQGSIHGLNLMQADGLDQLGSTVQGIKNRGDGGDPYPGTSANTVFGPHSSPAAVMNSTGLSAGLAVDQITQVVPNGAMGFRLRLGSVANIGASDSLAQVRVRGVLYRTYGDLFLAGDTVSVSMDTTQTAPSGRTRFLYASWSDGGAQSHIATMQGNGTGLTANVNRQHQATWSATGNGTIAASPNLASGVFLNQGDSVTLTATAGTGQAFVSWTGDTTTTNPALKLRMTRPFAVQAVVQAQLVVQDTVLSSGVMGASYRDTLLVAGGNGSVAYSVVSGTVPPGLTLNSDGTITGTATHDGSYNFTAQAASGVQTLNLAVRIVVTRPVLVLADVVTQYLTTNGTLTTAQIKFLDLNGNNNGLLDLGDFVAWLDATGQSVSADVMQRIMARSPR